MAGKKAMTQADLLALIDKTVGDKVADIAAEAEKQTATVKSELATALADNATVQAEHTARVADGRKSFGKILSAFAEARGDPDRAIRCAKARGAPEEVVKALSAGSGSGGGFVIAPEMAEEVIEALTANSVAGKLGASTLDINGTLTLPYVATGSSSYYNGENANATASEPAVAQLQLTEKKLVTLIPVSNDLLRQGSPKAENYIQTDAETSMRVKRDITFLRGSGTSFVPRGMLSWAGLASNTFNEANAATGANNSTTAEIAGDLALLIRKVMDQKVPLVNMAYVMPPKTWTRLQSEQTTAGAVRFPEMADGKLLGFPFHIQQDIPITNSTPVASSSSELYFGAWGNVLIAEGRKLELEMFNGATYVNSSGTMVSGISQDQTVVRLIESHDFGCRARGGEVAVCFNTWGVA